MNETQKKQRRYALAISGGVCEVCGKPLKGLQPQGAHRIGNTKSNRAKYGDLVIDHRYNIGIVCSLRCNAALDISFDTGKVIALCCRIYAAERQKFGVNSER